MKRIGLAVFVLALFAPCGLLGWDTSLPAGRFSCQLSAVQQGGGPDWLVRRDGDIRQGWPLRSPLGHADGVSASGVPVVFRRDVEGAFQPDENASAMSAWEQAGVYGLEFGGAAVGTCIAATASYAVASAAHADWTEPGRQAYLGLAAYAASSALLSSASTHLVGTLCHRRGSFAGALIGGTVGGTIGAVLLRQAFWGAQLSLLPVGLALSPLGSVVAYNI